jgi:preprotein translocase subunit SecA
LDFAELERVILLRTVDTQWIDHIDAMDMLRKGIGLRAYGQDDPVIAYKKEGFEMFDDMIFRIKKETVRTLMKMTVENKLERKSAVENKNLQTNDVVKPSTIRKEKSVVRNDPCPCGSGKKYKYCCMDKDNQNNNK